MRTKIAAISIRSCRYGNRDATMILIAGMLIRSRSCSSGKIAYTIVVLRFLRENRLQECGQRLGRRQFHSIAIAAAKSHGNGNGNGLEAGIAKIAAALEDERRREEHENS